MALDFQDVIASKVGHAKLSILVRFEGIEVCFLTVYFYDKLKEGRLVKGLRPNKVDRGFQNVKETATLGGNVPTAISRYGLTRLAILALYSTMCYTLKAFYCMEHIFCLTVRHYAGFPNGLATVQGDVLCPNN